MASRRDDDDDNNNQKSDDAPKPSLGTRMATGCHNFANFMYNSKDHTVMGRPPLSWGAILLYYLGFYAFLAGFWAACLAAFMRTIDFDQPTQQHKFSMLKDNPGMTYEPMTTTDNTIISFNVSDPDSYSNFTSRLDDVLKPYYELMANYTLDPASYPNVKICDPASGERSNINYVCLFNVTQFIPGECLAGNKYGFASGKPCIFLRPNKIFAYMPEPYALDDPNLNSTLKEPPADLHLTSDSIAVACEGENDVDKDNLLSVQFYPPNGYPFYFYPYFYQDNYLPPFVMAQFNAIPGRAMMIWCSIWAKGMKHDRNDRQGGIHFELLIDPPTPAPKI